MQRADYTIIVPAAIAAIMRNVSKRLDKFETDGMLIAPLSATGASPATHFVSSGQIPQSYVNAMNNPAKLEAAAKVAFAREKIAFPYTTLQITTALSSCMISDGTRTVMYGTKPIVVPETALAFIERQGLKQIR